MAVALQVHHTDDAVLGHQRDGYFGADVGVGGDVARVGGGGCRERARARAPRRRRRWMPLAEGNVVDVHALVVSGC